MLGLALWLRVLDPELKAHIKGADANFDLSKLAFFQEAKGVAQDEHIATAQSAVANAQKTSLQAAFQVFKTSLDNDHVVHDRFMSQARTDETRARNAALQSLEAWCVGK